MVSFRVYIWCFLCVYSLVNVSLVVSSSTVDGILE